MRHLGFVAPILKRLYLEVARDDQDLSLLVKQPTSSKARVDQDLSLLVKQSTGSKARVDQDLALLLRQPTNTNARAAQEVILYLVHRIPATELLAFTVPGEYIIPKKRSQGLFAQASIPVFPSTQKMFPIIFCVT